MVCDSDSAGRPWPGKAERPNLGEAGWSRLQDNCLANMTLSSLVKLYCGSFCPAALSVEAMPTTQQEVSAPVRWWVPVAAVVSWLQ